MVKDDAILSELRLFTAGKLARRVHSILARHGREAAARVKMHFGEMTGPAVRGGMLQKRSGRARASVSSVTKHLGPLTVMMEYGSLRGGQDVEKYFETQEIGRTIHPAIATEIRFPPGILKYGVRNARGAQIATAREFMADPARFGYAFYMWTSDKIIGRRIGAPSNDLEVVFVRRPFVVIPERAPVLSEAPKTVAAIEKDLASLFE